MRAADPARVRQLEDPLGAGVERAVDRMAEARDPSPALTARATRRRPPPARPGGHPLLASASIRAHASAVPRTTGPAPRIPAATAPCSDPGSAASVIRAATFVGIIPCSAIETSSRSRKKRWSSVGSRPVSSRWKYSVKLDPAHEVAAEVAPPTSTLSG